MKKSQTHVFAALVILAVVLAIVSIFAYAYNGTSVASTSPNSAASGNGDYPNGMMGGDWSGMMSGMMGGNSGSSNAVQPQVTSQNTTLPMVGLVALVGAVVTSLGGATYYLADHKTRTAENVTRVAIEDSPKSSTPYTSVSKTLTSEERKVLDVLVSHDGKYLQKYLRAETELSRLKIHRIVTRLAERGIVTLEKSGNTNEVLLSSWLQSGTETNKTTTKIIDVREIKVEE
jgi:uncharacterized membrane protein